MEKRIISESFKEEKLVGILGVFPFVGTSAEIIEHGLEHLVMDGYTPIFLENLEDIASFDAAKVLLNWVVSAGGLSTAQYLEKEKQIPYLASFPVGMRSMRQWRVHLAKVLGYEDKIEIPEKNTSLDQDKKVLLLGDPILTAGLKSFCQDMLGCKQVKRAHYVPLDSVKIWFDRILTRAEGHGLYTEDGEVTVNDSIPVCDLTVLAKLEEEADIIISDTIFKERPLEFKHKQWIELPDCIASCGLNEQQDYQLFGKKGAAWLTGKLAAMD